MATIDTVMIAIHLIFGAMWVGSVAFVTFTILPLARDGDLERVPFERMMDKVLLVSRVSALAMVISGTHMMGTGNYFDTEVLLESTRGQSVLAMFILWFVLIVIIEISTRRIKSGLGANLLREPARDGLAWFYTATLVGILLFLIGSLLTTGFV